MIDGRPREAARYFEEAIEIQRELGDDVEARYLSYYGWSLARCSRSLAEAVRHCERAVELDATDPTLYLNLGRVCALTGRVGAAIQALEGGLRQAPGHRALQTELLRVDRRARPSIPELDREHPINVWLGRLRSKMTRPREPGRRARVA